MRVVIPAYRAANTLPICIQALLRSNLTFEIIVVDDGENGDLRELLSPYPVQVLQGPHQGAAKARNRGAANYTGDILVFVDADVEVEPNAIERLTAPIRQRLSEAAVGNYSDDTHGMNFSQKYKQLYVSYIYSRRSGYLRNEFWTALGAVEAGLFAELGGFCSTYEPGEDTELGHRISQSGRRIFAVPEARGRHLKPYTFVKMILNDLRKGICITSLYSNFGERLSSYRHASPRNILAVCLAYFLIIMAVAQWLLPLPEGILLFLAFACAYLIVRSSMLAVYRRQGFIFLVKAVFTAFLLDLVRGLCILVGLSKTLTGRLRSRNRGESRA